MSEFVGVHENESSQLPLLSFLYEIMNNQVADHDDRYFFF